MDWKLLATTYGIIFVAEIPDKTALASLVLATRHRALPVFLGAGLALTVQSIVAVAAGQLVSLLPPGAIHLGAGVLFLLSALLMWLRKTEASKEVAGADAPGFWRVLAKVFVVIFIAEWGDLTQVGTAALAARYRAPGTIFLGSAAALWSVMAIAVFVGNRAGRLLDPVLTQKIAALLFAAVGVALLAGWI